MQVPVEETPLDVERLKKRFTRLLARRLDVGRTKIMVKVSKGIRHVFVLVESQAERHIVEETAREVINTGQVLLHARVRNQGSRTDSQLAGEILQCFSVCLGLDLSGIAVDVSDGVALIRGAVPSYDLKTAAESLARSITGIKQVISDLKVMPVSTARALPAIAFPLP